MKISVLIVDDDINKISAIIKTIREQVSDTLLVSQASSVQEAMEYLKKKEFHLLITDLQMPLKHDSPPSNNGGRALLKNMYKTRYSANIPLYIVGLTQFEDLKKQFNPIWKVWFYKGEEENWKVTLRDLIHHISLVKSRINAEKIETIFVEGPTDKYFLEKALSYYFNGLKEKIQISTISYGGGASWVERQLVIWAKSLSKKNASENYLKAVGIFDNDKSGLDSIKKLSESIIENSAESLTYSVIKNCRKYSIPLKAIKSRGVEFDNTVEDLIGLSIWEKAFNNDWLKQRDIKTVRLNPQIVDIEKFELTIQYLCSLGFTKSESILMSKQVKPEFKKKFCHMACSEPEELKSIKFQLDDILDKLKIIV